MDTLIEQAAVEISHLHLSGIGDQRMYERAIDIMSRVVHAAEAAAAERAARERALFAVLLVRLIEDELSRDIETGLLDQCLRAARAEILAELDRRIAELPPDRVHTLAHLRRYAAAIRALAHTSTHE